MSLACKMVDTSICLCYSGRLCRRALLRFLCIEFIEMMPLRRHVVFMENRLDRTFRNARFTVDALIWMNIRIDEKNADTVEMRFWRSKRTTMWQKTLK